MKVISSEKEVLHNSDSLQSKACQSTSCSQTNSNEKFLLEALTQVKKYIYSKLKDDYHSDGEDILQKISYKLWNWQQKKHKVLDQDEWIKLVFKSAKNEIASFYSEKYRDSVSLTETDKFFHDRYQDKIVVSNSVEGNSGVEIVSLLHRINELVATLTLRERYAFLLKSGSFLADLTAADVLDIRQLASLLEVSESDVETIITLLPLSDEQIAAFLSIKLRKTIDRVRIKEFRLKAKAKLNNLVNNESTEATVFVDNRTQ